MFLNISKTGDGVIKKFNPKGVILSGGPDTVTLNDSARAPQIVFDLGVPILGICYGMQTAQLSVLAIS
jgi:GMP synthase (glutamine-hydrolysing)